MRNWSVILLTAKVSLLKVYIFFFSGNILVVFDGIWSPWNTWSHWNGYYHFSTTCGVGAVVRFRSCENTATDNGSNSCPGDFMDVLQCNPVDCDTEIYGLYFSCNFLKLAGGLGALGWYCPVPSI